MPTLIRIIAWTLETLGMSAAAMGLAMSVISDRYGEREAKVAYFAVSFIGWALARFAIRVGCELDAIERDRR